MPKTVDKLFNIFWEEGRQGISPGWYIQWQDEDWSETGPFITWGDAHDSGLTSGGTLDEEE